MLRRTPVAYHALTRSGVSVVKRRLVILSMRWCIVNIVITARTISHFHSLLSALTTTMSLGGC